MKNNQKPAGKIHDDSKAYVAFTAGHTLKYRIIDSHGIKDAVWKFTPIPKRCTWNNRCTWPVGKLTTKDALEWIKDAPDQLLNQQ